MEPMKIDEPILLERTPFHARFRVVAKGEANAVVLTMLFTVNATAKESDRLLRDRAYDLFLQFVDIA